jgi:uncharacterized protein (TIGR04255 family)
MVRAKYNQPPIEEAICQLILTQRLPWESDTPRRLFEKLRDRYPAMPTQQQLLQANLTPPAIGTEAPGLSLAPTERVIFADTEDRSRLSVGPQTIGIHRARPYIGFDEDMLPRIKHDTTVVIESVQENPSFSGISVRYINKIEVEDATELELKDYFNYGSTAEALPSGFDGIVTGFFYRTAAKQSSSPLTLTLNFGSLAAPKDKAAFILDIDLGYTFEEPAETGEAIAKIVEVKAMENSIFESLITDTTRELFK